MKRDVIWAVSAENDLKDSIAYIAHDNPVAAKNVAARLREQSLKLGDFATGRKGRVSSTYEKPVPGLPYILVYKIVAKAGGGEVVAVVHLIHMARDWPPEDQV